MIIIIEVINLGVKIIVKTEIGSTKNSEKSPCAFSFLRSKKNFGFSPRGNLKNP